MSRISDSNGKPLEIQTLYSDTSLKDTFLEQFNICFLETYTIPQESPWEEHLFFRYQNGLFRLINSSEDASNISKHLRRIERKNRRGITFGDIRAHALRPDTQKECLSKYNTLNLYDVLKANLSAHKSNPNDNRAKDYPGQHRKNRIPGQISPL